MDIAAMTPMVVFDNKCYLCVQFAKFVNFVARGRISMVGHYTPVGEKLREQILGKSALEMFWLITEKNAYGGRAALLPLARYIISTSGSGRNKVEVNGNCNQECKTAKSVFIRSSSLLSNSKKIPL